MASCTMFMHLDMMLGAGAGARRTERPVVMAGGQEGFTKEGQHQLEVLENRGQRHSRAGLCVVRLVHGRHWTMAGYEVAKAGKGQLTDCLPGHA